MNDIEARVIRLEERYTHLQHHVTEQDRVILALREELDEMGREISRLRGAPNVGRADDMPADERPPHY